MTKAVSPGSGEPPGRHTDIVSATRPLSPSCDPLTDRLCAADDVQVHDRAADECLRSVYCGPSKQLARSPVLAGSGLAAMGCATVTSSRSFMQIADGSLRPEAVLQFNPGRPTVSLRFLHTNHLERTWFQLDSVRTSATRLSPVRP
jgi:hypothetical protein